jgi:hypothetical protein
MIGTISPMLGKAIQAKGESIRPTATEARELDGHLRELGPAIREAGARGKVGHELSWFPDGLLDRVLNAGFPHAAARRREPARLCRDTIPKIVSRSSCLASDAEISSTAAA